MDHSEALRTRAAERYLLGELSAAERDQYEEHFFGCVECAQEVQAGAAFIDSSKEALAPSGTPEILAKPKAPSDGWWTWILRPAFAAPAMALLLLVAVYQTAYEVPRLRSALSLATQPQTFSSLSLLSANSRGGEVPEITVPPNKPFGLFVDIPPEPRYRSYICEVREDHGDIPGQVKFSVTVSEEEAKQTVQLMVPPSGLPAGKYDVVVRGYESLSQQKVDVARYPFVVNVSR